MLLELNFDTEPKEISLIKNINLSKKDESTNSTQNQTQTESSKIIKDDLFFKNNESSFKLIESRRKTNSEFKSLVFKGNSPNEHKLFPQASFKQKRETKFFRDNSTKKVLPLIQENELRLPTQKSFKIRKNEIIEEQNDSSISISPSGSPEKKSLQPKIFIEIPKNGNKMNEKDNTNINQGFSGKLRNVNNNNNSMNNDGDEVFERGQMEVSGFANKQDMSDKNVRDFFFYYWMV